MAHTAYLLVNISCILIPFVASFHHRIRFNRFWKPLLFANILTMVLFIPWDILFTRHGIWGFNPDFTSGIGLAGLPAEEWLFFFTVPYACVFTYHCFRIFIPSEPVYRIKRSMMAGILMVCVVIMIITWGVWYPFYTALFTALFLMVNLFWKERALNGWALLSYIVLLIPFLLANGVLTGLNFYNYPVWNVHPESIGENIVWYNNRYNAGIRIWTVPVDDFLYGFLLITMNIWWYELFRNSLTRVQSKPSVTSTG